MKTPRTRSVLSFGLVAGLLWTGAMATFTDSDDVGGTFATGTVSIDAAALGEDAPAVFTITDMKPGDTVEDTIEVTNTGSLDFTYGLSVAPSDDPDGLGEQLEAAVHLGEDCDGTALDAGALHDLTLNDRVLAAGGSETLCVAVTLPLGTGNDFQGTATATTFTFSAEQILD